MRPLDGIFLFLLPWTVALGQEVLYFPQVGTGATGPFLFQTSVIFVNSGDDALVELDFLDGQGQPLELELAPFGSASSFLIPIPAGNSVSARTPKTGPLKVGYARFAAPASVGGTAVFTGYDSSSGTVLYEAGVPAAEPLQQFRLFLDSLGDRDTGVAIVAPLGSTPAGTPTQGGFTLLLHDKEFHLVETVDVPLASGEKLARYVHEFFPDPVEDQAREMEGSLTVISKGGPLAAVTLRQFNPPSSFPSQVPTLTAFPVVEKRADWKLVWSDEFDGAQLDRSKWEPQLGNGCPTLCGWGNNEREFYTDRSENLRLENGLLVIEARADRTHDVSYPYSSARIRTKGKGDWKYGRFVIRARTPTGKGLWPAIWMLPTDEVYGGWAASGEIDIMELVGHEPDRVHGTLHYGGVWPDNKSGGLGYTLEGGDFSKDFHEFVLEWNEREFRWFVDGKLYETQFYWYTEGREFPAPFDQRFHLIMNVAVGGSWPGPPNPSTVFPQLMEVDYVRIYQRAP